MIYKFNAYGHPNILATHKSTLEFTKDAEVSLKGDCIVGVKADFELGKIRNFIRNSIKNNNENITMTIEAISNNKKIQDKIIAEINPNFNSENEFVIRKTDFVSERTFAIKSNKAAFDLDKALIDFLRSKASKIFILIAIG